MADVTDILQGAGIAVGNKTSAAATTAAPVVSTPAVPKKKLTSAQREVLSLLERTLDDPSSSNVGIDALPPLAPGTAGGRKFAIDPSVKAKPWKLVEFANNARSDK